MTSKGVSWASDAISKNYSPVDTSRLAPPSGTPELHIDNESLTGDPKKVQILPDSTPPDCSIGITNNLKISTGYLQKLNSRYVGSGSRRIRNLGERFLSESCHVDINSYKYPTNSNDTDNDGEAESLGDTKFQSHPQDSSSSSAGPTRCLPNYNSSSSNCQNDNHVQKSCNYEIEPNTSEKSSRSRRSRSSLKSTRSLATQQSQLSANLSRGTNNSNHTGKKNLLRQRSKSMSFKSLPADSLSGITARLSEVLTARLLSERLSSTHSRKSQTRSKYGSLEDHDDDADSPEMSDAMRSKNRLKVKKSHSTPTLIASTHGGSKKDSTSNVLTNSNNHNMALTPSGFICRLFILAFFIIPVSLLSSIFFHLVYFEDKLGDYSNDIYDAITKFKLEVNTDSVKQTDITDKKNTLRLSDSNLPRTTTSARPKKPSSASSLKSSAVKKSKELSTVDKKTLAKIDMRALDRLLSHPEAVRMLLHRAKELELNLDEVTGDTKSDRDESKAKSDTRPAILKSLESCTERSEQHQKAEQRLRKRVKELNGELILIEEKMELAIKYADAVADGAIQNHECIGLNGADMSSLSDDAVTKSKRYMAPKVLKPVRRSRALSGSLSESQSMPDLDSAK